MQKLLKKILVVGVALVTLFCLGACSGKEEAPAGSASAGETYKLILSTIQPAAAPNTKAFVSTCDAIKERSNGRLEIEVFDSGTLLAANDIFKGVQSKSADIAFFPTNLLIKSKYFFIVFFIY